MPCIFRFLDDTLRASVYKGKIPVKMSIGSMQVYNGLVDAILADELKPWELFRAVRDAIDRSNVIILCRLHVLIVPLC
jgi:hypothetical protein